MWCVGLRSSVGRIVTDSEDRRRERGLNQIHINGLSGSIVQGQRPVMSLGIARISLVPPTGSRVSPPIPTDNNVIVCDTETVPIGPLGLSNGEVAAKGWEAVVAGVNRDFADVDFDAVGSSPRDKR